MPVYCVIWYLIKSPESWSLLLFSLEAKLNKVLLIIIVLYFVTGNAVAAKDLYSGEVAVASQREEDRTEAIPEALIRVLQKLSGQREMPISPPLEQALNNAERLLVSFRYKNIERTGPDGSLRNELRLVARFMQLEIDRVVREIGLPRWQTDRPTLQIWVLIDDGRERKLKPVEFEYAWEAIQDVADLRGLPISWPQLDEEEAQLIDMRLIWGGFTDYLIDRGVPGDGVLIIAARREGPKWGLRWNMADGENHWNWRNDDQELVFALVQGIHQVVDRVSTANAIAASEQLVWMLDVTIGDLKAADDYTRCLAYLQSQNLVTAVDVVGAEPGLVHFRLQLNASPEYLAESFERGSVLLPMSAENNFEYRFLP